MDAGFQRVDKVKVVNAHDELTIRRLPLHEKHAQCGARFGAFGQWEIPLYYTSILEEHKAVRTRAGVFDISHMGEFFLRGASSLAFLQELLCRDISVMKDGQALYMPLLNDRGGIIDDIILYRVHAEEFLFIVNASNIAKDYEWIRAHLAPGLAFENVSDAFGLLAVQGPQSPSVVARAFGEAFSRLRYYHFMPFRSGVIAHTGYTGEAGFEIMVRLDDLAGVWDDIFSAGAENKLVPVGFGARDTLRLEAAMPLYGHDLSDETTPLDAGLEWTVGWGKPSFIGRQALMKQKQDGVCRRLAGFEMTERGVARQHCVIKKQGQVIGEVTSGSFAPALDKNIGLGYVNASEAAAGNPVDIVIRDRTCGAKIVPLPFYRCKK